MRISPREPTLEMSLVIGRSDHRSLQTASIIHNIQAAQRQPSKVGSNLLTSVTRSTHPRDGVALSYSRRWRQARSPAQPVRGSLQENVLPRRPVLLLHLHARLPALSRLPRLLVSENGQLEHKRSSEQAYLEPMAHT